MRIFNSLKDLNVVKLCFLISVVNSNKNLEGYQKLGSLDVLHTEGFVNLLPSVHVHWILCAAFVQQVLWQKSLTVVSGIGGNLNEPVEAIQSGDVLNVVVF